MEWFHSLAWLVVQKPNNLQCQQINKHSQNEKYNKISQKHGYLDALRFLERLGRRQMDSKHTSKLKLVRGENKLWTVIMRSLSDTPVSAIDKVQTKGALSRDREIIPPKSPPKFLNNERIGR